MEITNEVTLNKSIGKTIRRWKNMIKKWIGRTLDDRRRNDRLRKRWPWPEYVKQIVKDQICNSYLLYLKGKRTKRTNGVKYVKQISDDYKKIKRDVIRESAVITISQIYISTRS